MRRSKQLVLCASLAAAAIVFVNLEKQPPSRAPDPKSASSLWGADGGGSARKLAASASALVGAVGGGGADSLAPNRTAVGLASFPQGSKGEQSRAKGELRDTYYADPTCNPTLHAGFQGGSLNWGMSFKTRTAEECCNACKAHAKTCVPGAGGRMYMNRTTFGGKVVREYCAETQTSNELGVAKASCAARPAMDNSFYKPNSLHKQPAAYCTHLLPAVMSHR